jgi:CO/xanthine dehydrogenase FAD-binding subunit
MIVDLTAAALHGANTTTLDIDLWFETVADPQIREAATIAGGIWISGFGMMPASLGGPLGDRLDVVLHMSGLRSFGDEHVRSRRVSVEGIPLRVLPLDRILASKRAANRPKDLAAIPALEEALAATEDESPVG